jgi:hypothetical protein
MTLRGKRSCFRAWQSSGRYKGDTYGFDVCGKHYIGFDHQPTLQTRWLPQRPRDGLDYYHVGLTLRAGNIALISTTEYTIREITTDGKYWTTVLYRRLHLNTTRLVDEKKKVRRKMISIDAGSQMYKVEAFYHFRTNWCPLLSGSWNAQAGTVLRQKHTDWCLRDEHGKTRDYGRWRTETKSAKWP